MLFDGTDWEDNMKWLVAAALARLLAPVGPATWLGPNMCEPTQRNSKIQPD